MVMFSGGKPPVEKPKAVEETDAVQA